MVLKDGPERTDFSVSSLGGCGGLARPYFLTVSTLGGYVGLERTDF